MDEVENPSLPAAGEASPTLRPEDSIAKERDGTLKSPTSPTRVQLPPRPQLKRETSAPAPPPAQAPPSAPLDPNSEAIQDAPDSLTLADLKRIRSTFPNAPQPSEKPHLLDFDRVYDFQYQDAQSLPVEIEEWFSYSETELSRLRLCKESFNAEWRTGQGRRDWVDETEDMRRQFVTDRLDALKTSDRPADRTRALLMLVYIALGVWEETAGRKDGSSLEELFPNSACGGSRLMDFETSNLQLQWIVAMTDTLVACGGLDVIYTTLQAMANRDTDTTATNFEAGARNEPLARRSDESIEMWCCLTLFYVFVEVARSTTGDNAKALCTKISSLEPRLLTYLTQIIAMLRWEESLCIPLTKMLLLSWKTILVTIGGIKDVEEVKTSLREAAEENTAEDCDQPIITASPLDYHLFRQEINSKYPAYQPPPMLFPIEPDNNSILPPLKHRRASYASVAEPILEDAAPVGSIMHQPVHIATPAPSPPPSPAGPGKAGKKQNYQTNQMFPFLYPPLDGSSNDLGGKGSTELQDVLVGRKWEGSDIPASIMEAAELFAKRMRATRAMKQMWQARVEYMKQERGWKDDNVKEKKEDSWLSKSLKVLDELKDLGIDGLEGLEDLDLDEDSATDGFEMIEKPATTAEQSAEQGQPLLPGIEQQWKLDIVENFYADSLQHLQSVVIVILKAVLQHVTDLVTRGNAQNGLGLQAGIQFNNESGINGVNDASKPNENGGGLNDGSPDTTSQDLDHLRSQEIAAKALSAFLLLLLKWFKVNHILQYEYLSQLLMDSNYVPLILKLWQTQEIGRACHYRLEREDVNFFAFCKQHRRQNAPTAVQPRGDHAGAESDDDAAPPPIKLKRESPPAASPASPASPAGFAHPPEVDELGYPTTPLPHSPIKAYSWRNVFTHINYLRVLQKVTRRKTHRALMLINYKSSQHLKKTLKIPVHMLRYYSLKVFKTQVALCGRKWRQGNMKIITAVWLSVPAELRDDWLAGGGGGMGGGGYGDVDGQVDDALENEERLREMTLWWNVRCYRKEMGMDQGQGVEEIGFFERELEKMGVFRQEEVEMLEGEGEAEQPMTALGGAGQWAGPIQGY